MILPIILVIVFHLCLSPEINGQLMSDFADNRLDRSATTYRKVVIKRETNDSTDGQQTTDPPPPPDICTDPLVYTIDRMANGTVRVYRDYYYWDLDGLPSNTTLSGPHLIRWEDMAPVTQNTRVMTDGESKITFRFENKKFWAYSADGNQFINGSDIALPDSLGGLFYDHKKPNPLMVCTRDITVFYFKFKNMKWEVDGQPKGYPMGRNSENLEPDMTTAFSTPANKGSYVVYMFKKDRFCRKSVNEEKAMACDWKENKDLFGCQDLMSTTDGNVESSDGIATKQPDGAVAPGVDSTNTTKKSGGSGLPIHALNYKIFAIILIITFLNFKSNL